MNDTKRNVLQNSKICLAVFLAVMVIFTIASCSGGKNKALKIAKSIVFYPQTYEGQYTFGDVCERGMLNPIWEAQKVNDDWYVTVTGNLTNTDKLPKESRQILDVYKSYGIDVEKMVYSITLLISDNGGQVVGGSTSYDSEYSEQDAEDTSFTVKMLYAIYDGIMNSSEE